MDRRLHMWPHQGLVEGKNHLSPPVGDTLPNVAQHSISCLCFWGHIAGLVSTRILRFFSAKPLWPPAYAGALWCSSPGTGLDICWTLWSSSVPISSDFLGLLSSSMSILCINHSSKFHTTGDWPPAGLCVAGHIPLSLACGTIVSPPPFFPFSPW